MTTWTEPIYDRTATDITNRTSKAFLNVADWIRIYGNTQHYQAVLNIMRSLSISTTVLTEPTITSFPSADEINQIIANIETLRVAAGFSTSIIPALDDDFTAGSNGITPTYEDVNDWEEALYLLLNALVNTENYFIRSGVSKSGQQRFWQSRFRQYPFIAAAASPTRLARSNVAICGEGMTWLNGFRRYA